MMHDTKRIEFMLERAMRHARGLDPTWSTEELARMNDARSALGKLAVSSPRRVIFDAIRSVIPFAAGMIEVLSAERLKEPTDALFNMPERFLSERARLIDDDPAIMMVARGPAGLALRGPDAMPDGAFERSTYNQSMYNNRFELDNITGMILSKGRERAARQVVVLWLFAGTDVRLSTWRECRLLELICDDIRLAVARARLPLIAAESITFQIMQEQEQGYVLLRSNGVLLEVNRRAVLLSEKYSPSGGSSWRWHVHSLIASTPSLQKGIPGSYRLRCPDGSGELELQVTRLAKENHDLSEDVTLIQMKESTGSRPVFQRLTPRQRQVAVLLVSSGLSNKQIAHELGISEDTLRKHVENIHKALGVHSRPELVALVLRSDEGHTRE